MHLTEGTISMLIMELIIFHVNVLIITFMLIIALIIGCVMVKIMLRR